MQTLALLILATISADKPSQTDLARYQKGAKDYAASKIDDVQTKLNKALGADRAKVRADLAAIKKNPPAPPLGMYGKIGTLQKEYTVAEVYPDGKAKLTFTSAVYDTDGLSGSFRLGSGNQIAQERRKVGEKEGSFLIETPEVKGWKAGDKVRLDKVYWQKPDGSLAPLPAK